MESMFSTQEAATQLALPDTLSKNCPDSGHPGTLLAHAIPAFSTSWGAAYLGDALDFLTDLPDSAVDLVITSPPYALHFKKEYGNAEKSEYVEWFRPFAQQIRRILKDTGSFVLNIGGSYNAGEPTRSLYQFKVLLMLCEELGFNLAQEFFWHNPAKLPSPAEWVNVRRLRVKDAVEYVWWLSKTSAAKADNRRVLSDYSPDMLRLIKRGYTPMTRPSGHKITAKFVDRGGSIPSNLIVAGNNESNSEYMKKCKEAGIRPHPARFPGVLPDFFIRFLTDEEDIVLDPFAGSNTVGAIAQERLRRWLAFESDPSYLAGARLRF